MIHKYHYFYKITNLINLKYYYGIHSTNNLDDGYMGSGKALKQAIKKYGIENFKKDIIKFFPNLKELSDFEKFIVNEDLVDDPNCYNLVKGGYFLDDKDILKLKESIVGLQKGENNSAYGKRWITKDQKTIRIDQSELEYYIENGWVPGRAIKSTQKIIKANANRVWIWKDGLIKFINKQFLNDYLESGWVRGRSKPKPKTEKLSKGWNLKNKSYITVLDSEGNKLCVSKDDPRYINGELISFNKGKVSVIDSEGNKLFVSVNDPRYINGELIPIQRKGQNLVLVRDSNDNYFKVPSDDPRYINGELIPATKGRVRPETERQNISKSKIKKTS